MTSYMMMRVSAVERGLPCEWRATVLRQCGCVARVWEKFAPVYFWQKFSVREKWFTNYLFQVFCAYNKVNHEKSQVYLNAIVPDGQQGAEPFLQKSIHSENQCTSLWENDLSSCLLPQQTHQKFISPTRCSRQCFVYCEYYSMHLICGQCSHTKNCHICTNRDCK